MTGLVQKLILAVLTFYAIPVFINKLGPVHFGIFAVLGVINEFGRLVNVGFNSSLIKFLSIQGKSKESSCDIAVAFLTMLVILAIYLILGLLLGEIVLFKIFNISPEYLTESQLLYNYLLSASVLLILGLIFSGILESQKRIYLVNYLKLIYSVFYWSAIIVVVHLGFGIVEVGMVAFTAAAVWFILSVIMAGKVWGRVHLSGLRKNFGKSLRKQVGYSSQLYADGILGLLWEPAIKIFVSNIFGITSVGYLEIGFKVRNQIYRLFQSMLWPLFQLFSEISDKQKIGRIVMLFQEKIVLMLIPLATILFFTMQKIVEVWIGGDVNIISNTVMFILFGALFGELTQHPNFYYWNVHKPVIGIINQLIKSFAMLIVLLIAHLFLGYKALYAGFVFSSGIQLFVGLYFQKKLLNGIMFSHRNSFFKMFLSICLIFGSTFLINVIVFNNMDGNILFIVINIIYVLPVSYLVYRQLKIITKNEIINIFGDSVKSRKLAGLFH